MKIASALSLALAVGTLASNAAQPKFRSLFNGKDLTGWVGNGYTVEDGTIVCTPEGKNLVTQEVFCNYVLEFDFKLPPGGNNGLGIHYPGAGDGAYTGMELQILDNTDPQYKDIKDYQYHGSLYTMAPAKRTGLKPVGEWNHERVTVFDSSVTVVLNGETILEANLAELSATHPKHEGVKRRAGQIGWLGHGDRVAFRNIEIAETAPLPKPDRETASKFTPLFNGQNLDGWKHGGSPEWTVINGILKHSGKPGTPSDLWTEKEYGDFTLVFDWRWSGRGPTQSRPNVLPDGSQIGQSDIEELDSGIYLRGNSKSQVNLWNWPVGSGEIYGYRTDPAMPAAVRAGATPRSKADRPVGEWNHTSITLKGDRISVTLNGTTVIENAQLPNIPARGAIGLQHHGSRIDFANIAIKAD